SLYRCTAVRMLAVCGDYVFAPTPSAYIYTLSLHDALPILTTIAIRNIQTNSFDAVVSVAFILSITSTLTCVENNKSRIALALTRSEEHTSELQSLRHLVCRLLLEKKKKINNSNRTTISITH